MGTRQTPITLTSGAGTALFGAAGIAVGLGFAALAAVRRNRPIHSVGTVVSGRLVIDAPGTTGSALFDAVGETPLIARLSRSASWPVQLPDIMGLALRIPGGGHSGGPADLLFASTGTGRLTRYMLQLRTSTASGPLTTMFPLVGSQGNIVFRLDPDRDPESRHRYQLSCSRNSGPWSVLGGVSLEPSREPTQRSNDPAGPDDPELRFRPVAQPPTGLSTPAWLRGVRGPAYAISRRVWHA
ncbi:hypothetical protein [Nesterenkonia lutea]|uniref:Phosphodiesterase n=1 Tax=Nesterenkonia lutea TaxID=272919 RepID=A0ABR9JEJ8_9MICC|nr:hypothetical protein [Nesterenkonia lutea]MBE1524363.1 hypothetical protein [Nesterenkonia lutea]